MLWRLDRIVETEYELEESWVRWLALVCRDTSSLSRHPAQTPHRGPMPITPDRALAPFHKVFHVRSIVRICSSSKKTPYWRLVESPRSADSSPRADITVAGLMSLFISYRIPSGLLYKTIVLLSHQKLIP
jgi:hypothetical protein